jgi:hypothetical protein
MKNTLLLLLAVLIISCKGEDRLKAEENNTGIDTTIVEENSADVKETTAVKLTLEEANKLADLPLKCLNIQYPNKLGQTLGDENDLQSPMELHPAFYGCFDWHSSVHAHWSLVRLLKKFPKLDKAEEIREKLKTSLSKENIAGELAYFRKEHNRDYERTYGWAWLLKLSQELKSWDYRFGRRTSCKPGTTYKFDRGKIY